MQKFLQKIFLTLGLASLSLTIATSAFAQTKSLAELTALTGDIRQQTLIEGAKKEGEVTVYMASPGMALVNAAFTKKYGIKVNAWRAGSEAVLRRVVTEARGGRNEVDLVENNAPEMEALFQEKFFQEMKSPYLSTLMPQALPAHKEWVGICIDIFTLGYNTQKVKKEDLPKTWADLLHPRWKGMLGAEADDHAWFSYVLQALGEEKGTKLFKEMVATNEITVRKGHSLLAQLVAAGEVPMGFSLYAWGVDQLKDKGAPIERFYIGEPIAQFQGLGVIKKTTHPHAAVLYYDFVLSEGQAILSKNHFVATSNQYDQAVKSVSMKFIDPTASIALNEKWQKVYQDIFIKRVK